MNRILLVKECPACGYYHASMDGKHWMWLSLSSLVEVISNKVVINEGNEICPKCLTRWSKDNESKLVPSGDMSGL